MLRERIQQLRSEIERIARANRVAKIRLFGSVQRGEETPDSDVDFLVLMESGASLLDLSGLKLDLEDLLGRRVDVIDEGSIRKGLQRRILSEAAPI